MKEPINVQARMVEVPPPGGLTPGDIYYIVFRHKWKIIAFSAAGFITAAVMFFTNTPVYRSEAKLLVRFVLDTKSVTPETTDSQFKSPDVRGENIINSELEILTSLDLANQVVDAVGAEKILAHAGGGTNHMVAANAVRRNLIVDVPKQSVILRIVFQHENPAIVQPVLTSLIDAYLRKHVEIHQGVGILDDFFSRQADQLRARLSQTEQDLKKLKTDAQVISLEDTKRACFTQISKILEDIMTAETELAERKAILAEAERLLPAKPLEAASGTNLAADVVTEYRNVCAELASHLKRQQEMQTRYKDEHPLLQVLRGQISVLEARKRELDDSNPQLAALDLPLRQAATNFPAFDFIAEATRVNSLEARAKVLNAQLGRLRADAVKIIEAEPTITQLQRKRELEEANYRYYSSSLEQARIDETLGAGKITNIKIVQAPSPAMRQVGDLLKRMAIAIAAGILSGFCLAFVKERFLDQTIKREQDVERQLHIPLFLSIPATSLNGRLPLPFRNRHAPRPHAPNPTVPQAREAGAEVPPGGIPQARAEVAPWDPQHKLRTYYEGLRDRLVTYFEVRNMTHKPKLVAVTSCTRGAGVTTLAAGLAATLSETGDGNVLLVDMNLEQGAAHQFYKGKPECGLSEAFEAGTRDTALVAENFYLVSAQETNNQKLPRVLPKRFANLVPRMKASDYDYIIFDMPPVTQTSVTPRLAGFMDMVLMVIESEKTGQEIVKRANALLGESRANVAAVLNKRREYLPHRLTQEL